MNGQVDHCTQSSTDLHGGEVLQLTTVALTIEGTASDLTLSAKVIFDRLGRMR